MLFLYYLIKSPLVAHRHYLISKIVINERVDNKYYKSYKEKDSDITWYGHLTTDTMLDIIGEKDKALIVKLFKELGFKYYHCIMYLRKKRKYKKEIQKGNTK